MDAQKQSRQLLREHGTSEGHGKHEKWRVNGHLIVVTNTRTDPRGWLNKLCEIKRAIKTPYVGRIGAAAYAV